MCFRGSSLSSTFSVMRKKNKQKNKPPLLFPWKIFAQDLKGLKEFFPRTRSWSKRSFEPVVQVWVYTAMSNLCSKFNLIYSLKFHVFFFYFNILEFFHFTFYAKVTIRERVQHGAFLVFLVFVQTKSCLCMWLHVSRHLTHRSRRKTPQFCILG